MNNTALSDRILWYDGDSTFTEESLTLVMQSGKCTKGLCVDKMTESIIQYNKLVPISEQICVKNDVRDFNFEWNIPQEYKEIDIDQYVKQQFVEILPEELQSTDDLKIRFDRVRNELDMYRKLDLLNVLRTLVYIINTLREKGIPWGIGRGSSVSSYILYLIGVHDVDSVKYDLDITDFLHE